MKAAIVSVLMLFAFATTAAAEDLNAVFKKVNEYVAAENYPKALEELGWAKKEIEKKNSQKLASLLPSEINGYKGDAPKVQSALGFTNIERKYTNGAKRIELSLTGGAGNAAGLGGLAGLAKMGMMMEGMDTGSDTFRIDGRTANLKTVGANPELTIILESGEILKLETRGASAEELKSFGEQIKVGALDNYLKGSATN